MAALTEDTTLIADAFAYVRRLFRELSDENGSANIGTQNQAVDFILGDPELAEAVRRWGERTRIDEASTRPPQRLKRDALFDRVSGMLSQTMAGPVFPQQPSRGQ